VLLVLPWRPEPEHLELPEQPGLPEQKLLVQPELQEQEPLELTEQPPSVPQGLKVPLVQQGQALPEPQVQPLALQLLALRLGMPHEAS
jgi:hypothetical protein